MPRETIKVSILHEQTNKIYNFEVGIDDTIEDLKALLEVETKVFLGQQHIYYNNKEVMNTKTLKQLGLKDHDLLIMRHSQPQQTTGGNPFYGIDFMKITAKELQQFFMNNKILLEQIKQLNPALAKAITDNDQTRINQFIKQVQERMKIQKREVSSLLLVDKVDQLM